MKRNFYLQHPLMAMCDPRMEYLLEKEKLKGTGAYWFVIEKLAMLPDSCGDMKYLRPFCKLYKISFAYVKKIIFGYGLFDFEEDGSFMPAELNPIGQRVQVRKETDGNEDEKPEKTVREKMTKNSKKRRRKRRKKALKIQLKCWIIVLLTKMPIQLIKRI